YSIYQLSFKDLSLLVDKDLPYDRIQKALRNVPKQIKRFYPIDLYESEELKEKKSLTLRFAVQSDEKTLTEEEIAQIMQEILRTLEQEVGAKLR
ncbi:MAG: phenylalanine--tRNA ligase subunit beta, partial [Epsilonproteobacteria bacterium]|nr:phenylalanine--tRNA ligase subunit beta [Campylobacterota bacterium]NPA64241.1 phenylalanine--tRNA ligase subunit beta [Campylobacterota bacterium]